MISMSVRALRSLRPRLTPSRPLRLEGAAAPVSCALLARPAWRGASVTCCANPPWLPSPASDLGEALPLVLAPPLVLVRGARTRGGQGQRPEGPLPGVSCARSPLLPPSEPLRELRRAALTAAQWTAAS